MFGTQGRLHLVHLGGSVFTICLSPKCPAGLWGKRKKRAALYIQVPHDFLNFVTPQENVVAMASVVRKE